MNRLSRFVFVAATFTATPAWAYDPLVDDWIGPNCEGMGFWENTVRVSITTKAVIGSDVADASYTYSSGVCLSELSILTRSGNVTTWDDHSVSSGCIDGVVTMRYLPLLDRLSYTWSDPTGETPTCSGVLHRVGTLAP